ncbi:MAG: hypothetical protein QOD06_3300 [Candidatus Binatota bacterium]|jgi:hypothetical protein|nr:hypothetical protein [Candidatus Binatota bacterium]
MSDPAEEARRIESLMAEIDSATDSAARAKAREMLRRTLVHGLDPLRLEDQPEQAAPPDDAGPVSPDERCELCASAIATDHGHLLEVDGGRPVCICDACSLPFGGQAVGPYRRIPRRVHRVERFASDAEICARLGIPLGLAFLRRDGNDRILAGSVGPAGVTESELPAVTWSDLAEERPLLASMDTVVEALFVDGSAAGGDAFLLPIDECYRLAGRLRAVWSGPSGGPAVVEEIQRSVARWTERSG